MRMYKGDCPLQDCTKHVAWELRRSGIDLDDVLTAARERQGLDRLDQIKYAILEKNGGISIVPRSQSGQ